MSIRYVCEMGLLPPATGVWIPNLLLILICVYLLGRAGNYRRLFFFRNLTLCEIKFLMFEKQYRIVITNRCF